MLCNNWNINFKRKENIIVRLRIKIFFKVLDCKLLKFWNLKQNKSIIVKND